MERKLMEGKMAKYEFENIDSLKVQDANFVKSYRDLNVYTIMIFRLKNLSDRIEFLLRKSPPLEKEGQGGFGRTVVALAFRIPLVLPLPKGETNFKANSIKVSPRLKIFDVVFSPT